MEVIGWLFVAWFIWTVIYKVVKSAGILQTERLEAEKRKDEEKLEQIEQQKADAKEAKEKIEFELEKAACFEWQPADDPDISIYVDFREMTLSVTHDEFRGGYSSSYVLRKAEHQWYTAMYENCSWDGPGGEPIYRVKNAEPVDSVLRLATSDKLPEKYPDNRIRLEKEIKENLIESPHLKNMLNLKWHEYKSKTEALLRRSA